MSRLKDHPFAVEAFFNCSTVLSFAIPKEQLVNHIPNCLELDTFQDKWAFLAIAMVDTSALRPKGFPAFLGRNFYLIGYRVFVRYRNTKGKNLRGLYILKSETNKKLMQLAGNLFTHYEYTTTDINIELTDGHKIISSNNSKFKVDQKLGDADIPEGSPFTEWKEARRFAGPLPFTFTVDEEKKSILIIEGVRQNWNPQPICIEDYSFEFLKQNQFTDIRLASAFEVTNIPYYWKKGTKEKWQ